MILPAASIVELDLSEPEEDPGPKMHRRAPKDTAMCAMPVKQLQLTDDLGNVDCPACWRAIRRPGGGCA